MSATIDWNDDPRLVAYVLGELSGDDLGEIERALISDPSCRAALDEITGFLPDVERAVRAGAVDSGLAIQARASIAEAARRGPLRKRRAWVQPALAAAAGLLITTVLVIKSRGGMAPADTTVATAMPAESTGESVARSAGRGRLGSATMLGETVADEQGARPDEALRDLADLELGSTLEAQSRMLPVPSAPSAQGAKTESRSKRRVLSALKGDVRVTTQDAAPSDLATVRSEWEAAEELEEESIVADYKISDHNESVRRPERVSETFSENTFVLAKDDPLSTFSIDVDTASYTNVRRSLVDGRYPAPSAVRIEEFVNYFSYDDAPPAGDAPHPFAVKIESGAAPWMHQHRLVRISLKGRAIDYGERAPANLVFLIDVSGSMNKDDKLPLVKTALTMLTESLEPDDRVAIVVYAASQGLALPSTPVAAREAILQSLERLEAGGSTNGGAGIQLAYSIAADHFVEGGINRVILCTDGDFNVGVTSDDDLESLIAEKARSGIDLTVLGFGTGNFQDAKMEALSNRGNGNFAYIDSELEARKVLVTEAGGTLNTIAKDVKLQVVWNPSLVQAFRLIGYENRMLEHADFADDTKDAGEIGAGHGVTALYEVVPWGAPFDADKAGGARPDPTALDAAGGAPATGPFVTVRLRYKLPGEDESALFEVLGIDGGAHFDGAPEALRFSASVAAFGMLLRESSYVGESTLEDVRRWALESLGDDPGGLRAGFLDLVTRAIELRK